MNKMFKNKGWKPRLVSSLLVTLVYAKAMQIRQAEFESITFQTQFPLSNAFLICLKMQHARTRTEPDKTQKIHP